jgi:hypothetical protein
VEYGAFMSLVVFMGKKNDRSSEEHERILEKLKSLFFFEYFVSLDNSFYLSLHDLPRFFCSIYFLLIVRCFLIYTSSSHVGFFCF